MKPTKHGRRIRKLRRREGLSQYELAARLRWSRSHVANLENGYRVATPMHLKAVRSALR